jgi:hypothetical protein
MRRFAPADIDQVRVGMSGRVMLQAYNSYRVPKIPAEVITVSADSIPDPKPRRDYVPRSTCESPQSDLRKLPKGVRLYRQECPPR